MLFPENPEKRPELWTSLRTQLNREPMCILISNSRGNADAIATMVATSEIDEILQRMKSAKICRIGASRSGAISPHFAATLDGNVASITELMASPCNGISTVITEKLKSYLEMAVINLFYAGGSVTEVFVPIHTKAWSMIDADIQSLPTGLTFKKKA